MAATNSFNKSNWVTMDGLDLLLNTRGISGDFNTDFQDNYGKEFAVGATVTIPLPQRYIARTTLTYSPQSMARPTTTITVDQIRGIDLEWDSIEKALDMERGEERVREIYLKPAVSYIRQGYDDFCAQFAYQNTPMIVGALGTNPSTIDGTSAAALEAFVEMGCPVEDVNLGLYLPPVVTRAVKNTGLTYFNPVTDISKQYRTGRLGKLDSFDTYNSMSLYSHTAGTWAGTVSTNGGNQTGSSLAVNCTAGDTFKKGDVFKIASVNAVNLMTRRSFGVAKTFVITADVTASGATATLPIYPAIKGPGDQQQNVDALPGATATLTLFPGTNSPNGKSGINALALYKDAFLLAGVKLELPKAVELASQTQDPETGIALRFVRQWDNVQSRMTNRYDSLFGAGVGLAEQCAARVLCA